MDNRCDYSRLTIPNDDSYSPVAGRYTSEVARKMGFPDAAVREIGAGTAQALADLIEYSYEADERDTIEIGCERAPQGIRIVIRDRGLPLGQRELRQAECHFITPTDPGGQETMSCLERYFDEVQFRNVGREGKETVLLKRSTSKNVTDYYDACELEPFESIAEEAPKPLGRRCFTRALRPGDAPEVAKTVYKAYGYTYLLDHVYYPERLVELNDRGLIHSAVACADNGEIVGHLALAFKDASDRIAEIGQGVVKPEYRRQGCINRLTEFLLERARSLNLTGVYGQAVTNHTYTQRTGLNAGFHDCGVALGYVPSNVDFRALSGPTPDRMSVVAHFRYLIDNPVARVWLPGRHEAIIRKIYSKLGATIEPPDASGHESDPRETVVSVSVYRLLNMARIQVERHGPDVVDIVKTRLRELRLKRVDVIHLYLDLSDPDTAGNLEAFEDLGFIFCVLLPAGSPRGDALVLQNLNNVYVDFGGMKVESELGGEILEYVKGWYEDPEN